MHFHKLKVCGNPAMSKSIGAIFQKYLLYFVSLCHALVIQTSKFQTFSLLFYLICGQRSLMLPLQKYYDTLKGQMMVSVFFSIQVFF